MLSPIVASIFATAAWIRAEIAALVWSAKYTINAFCPAISIFIGLSGVDYLANFFNRRDALVVITVHA